MKTANVPAASKMRIHCAAVTSGSLPGQGGHEGWQKIGNVDRRAQMSMLEDRRAGIRVDGHDHAGAAHAFQMFRRSGDAKRQIELRPYLAAGLADLALP